MLMRTELLIAHLGETVFNWKEDEKFLTLTCGGFNESQLDLLRNQKFRMVCLEEGVDGGVYLEFKKLPSRQAQEWRWKEGSD